MPDDAFDTVSCRIDGIVIAAFTVEPRTLSQG